MSTETAVIVDLLGIMDLINSFNKQADIKGLLNCVRREKFKANVMHIYVAVPSGTHERELNNQIADLQLGGFTVFKRPAKAFEREEGRFHKTDVSVDITVAAWELYETGMYRHIVFVTADAELKYLIERLQKHGIKVSVASLFANHEQKELGMTADSILQLNKLIMHQSKKPFIQEKK